MKKLIILFFGCFLLCGCSYKELNDLAIVTAVGIDYVDNQYLISTQIMDLQKGENDQTSEKAVLYQAYGPTIVEALRNIMEQYPRTIYLGHLELAVLGKDVVEQKTNDIFDFFISSPESSNDFLVFVNKDGLAVDIINPKLSSNEESNPTKDLITSLLNIDERQGTAYEMNFEEFLSIYLEEGKDPVLPVVKLKSDDQYSNVVITEMTPFKNNVLHENLNKEQAIALSTLNNSYYDIPVSAYYHDNLIALLLLNPKSEIDLEIKNNEVNVTINSKLEAHTSEMTDRSVLSKPDTAKEIEKIYEQTITEYIESLLSYCKKYNVDVLGLKNIIYKHYNKQYDKYKDLNIYEIANININVSVSMYRYGNAYVGISK